MDTDPCTICREVVNTTNLPRSYSIEHSPGGAFFGDDGRNAAEGATDIRGDSRLRAHLNRFKRAKGHIGNELGRGTCGQVDGSLPLARTLFAYQVAIELLEELIAPVLESTLGLWKTISISSVGGSSECLHCSRRRWDPSQ